MTTWQMSLLTGGNAFRPKCFMSHFCRTTACQRRPTACFDVGQPIVSLPGGIWIYQMRGPHGDAEVIKQQLQVTEKQQTVCQQQHDAEGIGNEPSAATEGTQSKVLPRVPSIKCRNTKV